MSIHKKMGNKEFGFLKKLTLHQKIIIPMIAIYMVFSAFFIYMFDQTTNRELENKLEDGKMHINSELKKYYESTMEKALMMATSIALNPIVQQSYEIYYQTYDLDTATKFLDRKIQTITASIEGNLSKKINIHFHYKDFDNNIKSFYRNWSGDKDDNLSPFRSSLNKTYLTEKPVTGIESGKDGFFIRGIHPIYDENKTILGSVEVFFPFSDLLDNIYVSSKSSYCILMLSSSKSLANIDISGSGFSKVFDDFLIVNNDNSIINLKEIGKDHLLAGLNSPDLVIAKPNGYIINPIIDYENNTEGLIVYQMDLSHILNYYRSEEMKIGLAFLIFIILSIGLMSYISKIAISRPVQQVIKTLTGLARGESNRRMKIKSNDEISQIKRAINQINENLINIEHFAHQIGDGKFEVTFRPRSKKDTLAYTLVNMKKKLLQARDNDENRRLEEQKRDWKTKGITMIYDVLRENSSKGEELLHEVIGVLVKYVKALQGGIFLIDKEGEYLKMMGCYAYDRNKYLQKKVYIKEGLIGRCFQEKEPILIDKLPESYLKIVSGVGEKSPNHLFLAPLMHDKEIKGVIELASFNKFEDHDMEFVVQACSQLATAIIDIEYNERTVRLLKESQDKEQKLTQQEEEMRQNMEEMKATQEEFERKEKELLKRIKELESKS